MDLQLTLSVSAIISMVKLRFIRAHLCRVCQTLSVYSTSLLSRTRDSSPPTKWISLTPLRAHMPCLTDWSRIESSGMERGRCASSDLRQRAQQVRSGLIQWSHQSQQRFDTVTHGLDVQNYERRIVTSLGCHILFEKPSKLRPASLHGSPVHCVPDPPASPATSCRRRRPRSQPA